MKIGLTGSMSVGKTYIAKKLSLLSEFQKYSFFIEESKKMNDEGIPLNRDSTYKGQLRFFAKRIEELSNNNFVADRTILDVWAFSKTSELISDEDKNKLELIKNQFINKYDILFYIPIVDDIKLKNNGIRNIDNDYRILIDKVIKKEFDDYKGKKHILKSINAKDRIIEIMECLL